MWSDNLLSIQFPDYKRYYVTQPFEYAEAWVTLQRNPAQQGLGSRQNCSQGIWLIWKLFHTFYWSYRLKGVCINKRRVSLSLIVMCMSLAILLAPTEAGLPFNLRFLPTWPLCTLEAIAYGIGYRSRRTVSAGVVVLFSSNWSRVAAEVGVSNGNRPFLSEAAPHINTSLLTSVLPLCGFYWHIANYKPSIWKCFGSIYGRGWGNGL